MNGAYQAYCPKCRALTWVPENEKIDQANCAQCGAVFAVQPSAMVALRSSSLRLWPDPSLSIAGLDLYEALRSSGIQLDSTQEEILRVFPHTPAEEQAHDQLTFAEKRLSIDLLMYPLWRTEDPHDEMG